MAGKTTGSNKPKTTNKTANDTSALLEKQVKELQAQIAAMQEALKAQSAPVACEPQITEVAHKPKAKTIRFVNLVPGTSCQMRSIISPRSRPLQHLLRNQFYTAYRFAA